MEALAAKMRRRVQTFLDWGVTNGVLVDIGEFGWPNNTGNGQKGDGAQWDDVGAAFYGIINSYGAEAKYWSVGEWWYGSTGGYKLAPYLPTSASSGVWSTRAQSQIIERADNLTPAGAEPPYYRGVNVNGADFGHPGYGATTSATFGAPDHLGTPDVAYHYDQQATFDYVAARGAKVIRFGIRWERLQPTLGAALSTAEQTRLTTAISRAGNAGLRVVIGINNYGKYFLWGGASGTGYRIAETANVTQAHYNDFLTRLSNLFQNNATVLGYDIMGEPNGYSGGAAAWETVSASAVAAIRTAEGAGTHKWIYTNIYGASDAVAATHGAPWVTDATGKHRYSAHFYWDADQSGTYTTNTAGVENLTAEQQGYGPFRQAGMGAPGVGRRRGGYYENLAASGGKNGSSLIGTRTSLPTGVRLSRSGTGVSARLAYFGGTPALRDFELTTEMRLEAGTEADVLVRYQDDSNYLYAKLTATTLDLFKVVGGVFTALGSQTGIDGALDHLVRIRCQGSTVSLALNGRPPFVTATETTLAANRKIALQCFGTNPSAHWKYLQLDPL